MIDASLSVLSPSLPRHKFVGWRMPQDVKWRICFSYGTVMVAWHDAM